MKYLPTDVNTFNTMITSNYIYVDKTQHIYDLFSGGSRYYFLSRPRRFGKSLLISTLKELFLGNKELFKDLWITTSDYSWQAFPVIHLDFSLLDRDTVQELKLSLTWMLTNIAEKYGIDISRAPTLNAKFALLVERLAEKNKVVILIDEYDKPLLDHLADVKRAQAHRDFLKGFYDTIKGLDAYLRAVFITGVSKFSKTSLFSGINNLNDISLKPESASLLGYTKEEIITYFNEHIKNFAHEKGISQEVILDTMLDWYNGYRFSKEPLKVYNPFSILYYLKDKEVLNYWFQSGTPSFLVSLLRKQYETLEDISRTEVSMSSLGTFELENIPLIPLLFQTGYLTIIDYDENTQKFSLDYPNLEVEESFTKYLVATLTQTSTLAVDTAISNLHKALNANDLESFCSYLQTLFAQIPYTLYKERESYYHSLFQFLMSLMSIESQSEVLTNVGRIDLVIIMQKYLYIFELKFNANPDTALQQIKDRKYYERYLHQGKYLVLVGLCFNHVNKALSIEWQQESYSPVAKNG